MRCTVKIGILLLAILLWGSVGARKTAGATPGTALAVITIKWPEQVNPEAPKVESVRLEARAGDKLLAITAVDRPVGTGVTSTVMNNLSAGDLVFSAVACSQPNGHDDFDLTAEILVKAQNRSNIYLSFTTSGVVSKIDVSPLQSRNFVGSTLKLYTTPRNADGDIVLTKDGEFLWNTSNQTVATVDESGLVMGLTGGSARITSTEVATGKSGGMDLSILSAGRIEEEVVWEGVITLTGDITIGPQGKLKILPGTSLLFQPLFDSELGGVDSQRIELVVEKGGVLDADGGWPGSIVFTTNQKGYAGGWYGLRIFSNNVTLRNCTIENATVGLTVNTDSLSLEQVAISYCSESGISVTPNGNVNLKKANLEYNPTGIIVSKGAIRINESIIANSSTRALVAEEATVIMDGSKVTANQNGIFGRKSELNIVKSAIRNNGTNGVHAIGCNLRANNNIIADNGVGLRLERTDGHSVMTCRITSNGVGLQVDSQKQTSLGKGNQVSGNTSYEILLVGQANLVADGIFWDEPTTGQLNEGVGNLEKIFDRQDNPVLGQVIINRWENRAGTEDVQEPVISFDGRSVHVEHDPGHSHEVQTGGNDPGPNSVNESNEAYGDEIKAKQKYIMQNHDGQNQADPSQSQY